MKVLIVVMALFACALATDILLPATHTYQWPINSYAYNGYGLLGGSYLPNTWTNTWNSRVIYNNPYAYTYNAPLAYNYGYGLIKK